MKNATLYKVDGTSESITPANGTDFQLEELYRLLNVEVIEVQYLLDDRILIMDEEGKLHKNPQVNLRATEIWMANGGEDDIVGNAIVCPVDMVR